MQQILSNIFFIFILPLLLGAILRLIGCKSRRPILFSVCFVLLAIITWGLAAVFPNHGSEMFLLIAVAASCLALGSIITGIIVRIRRLRK